MAVEGAAQTSAQLLAPQRKRSSPVVMYLRRNPLALVGSVLMLTMLVVAVLAPWIAPHPYDEQNLRVRTAPPVWAAEGSASHLLGTDQLGRDILSRIIFGTRVSLGLATGSIAVAAVIGILLGLVAGYYGGGVDALIMRITDVQLSLPYLLFAIAVVAILGPSITNLILIMVLYSWAAYARLIRVATMSLRTREFVTASRSLGARDARLLLRHIAPNVLAPAIIVTTYKFAELVIMEASLSFLGLGVQPPMPSWGGMLGEGREYFTTAWWLTTFPGVTIILAALGANVLGDSLRDFLDPRLRRL